MPVIRANQASLEHPSAGHLARGYGEFVAQLISDDGGLTQFGAFVETLKPGARSGNAHWHENEDEFLFVFSGSVRLHEGELVHDLGPGDAATFKANVPIGHYLENVTDAETSYLMVGTRAPTDVVHLTDQDAVLSRVGDEKTWTNAAGDPI